jgi:small subunit ribosomal protein S1
VHISELAAHHVENPREIVSQGDVVSVKIIEMDAERRRLSLSLKRVEGEEPRPRPEGAPPLRLSEEVFSDTRSPVLEEGDEVDLEGTEVEPGVIEAEVELEEPAAEAAVEAPEAEEPAAEAAVEEPEVEEPEVEEPVAEAPAGEPIAEAAEPEPAPDDEEPEPDA